MPEEQEPNQSPVFGIVAIFGGMALLLIIILAGRPQSLPLTETYTSQDGTLTYNYPQGWINEEVDGQIIYSDPAMLDGSQDGLKGLILLIAASWVDTGTYLDDTIRYAQNPSEGLNALLSLMGQASSEVNTQNVRSFTINGRAASRAFMVIDKTDFAIIIFDEGDGGLYSVLAFSQEGRLRQFEPTVMAIIQSLEYTPAGNE